jgi:transposase
MSRRKRYSAEFKREALRRANEPGVTDVLVAEELGISARQLRRWRDAVKRDGEKAFPGQGKSRDEEVTQLKRKLAKVEQERFFLKAAAG